MAHLALITGASRGIGRAIALKLAGEGYDLMISCLQNKEELEKTRQLVREKGVVCHTFLGDMGNPADCERMFSLLPGEGRDLEVLVNNAGISYIGLLQDMSSEDWDTLIKSDLGSVFYCSKLAIPRMVSKKRGSIINISSIWGVSGASCEVAYSAAKGGVNAFTRALAKELAPSSIKVNAIACGAIDTQMNAFLSPREKRDLIEQIP